MDEYEHAVENNTHEEFEKKALDKKKKGVPTEYVDVDSII